MSAARDAAETMSEHRPSAGEHVRATPGGQVTLRVSGSGPATVTLRSARAVPPRWLERGPARRVVLGTRRAVLRPGARTTVTFQLSPEHLALLRRMRTIRVAVRLQSAAGHQTRRISLHSPAVRSEPCTR